MSRFAIIGDVHSQSYPLRLALEHCEKNSLRPILLGDLFDSQCEVSDSTGVYQLVTSAQKELGAIVLRSNHQNLLEGLARKEDVSLKKDLARTVLDFQRAGICLREVGEWLESFPYMVVFRGSSGLEYRIAHAEIPDSISVPNTYQETWQFYDPSPEQLRLLLWGKPYSVPDKERFWWHSREERNWVAVAGHYHKVYNKNRALVLDAGCGGKTRSWYDKRLPELLLYVVDEKEIVSFPVFEQNG